MDFCTKQVFFFIFCNSSPTCRGRRILAIYYVKTCKKFKLDQEASVKNIMEEFSLSEEDASNYVKKYW